jgi:glutamate/aspartate transport system permease protein
VFFVAARPAGILRTAPNRMLAAIGTLYVAIFRNIPLNGRQPLLPRRCWD